MKNIKQITIVLILVSFALPVYAQKGGGQNRSIAEMGQYLFYAVIAVWLLRKMFKK